ncbi:hypothetical protein HZA42_03900 [Candidatus Peregrinibacteria bacterium]|nr:hypothetical protein [Candidatus Peregrinibacteria bacterium]
MDKKNILLVRTKKGLRYSQIIQDYLWSRGLRCFVAEIDSISNVMEQNWLDSRNTLIHSRTAAPLVNKKIARLEKEGFKIINSSRTLNWTSNKYLSQKHAKKSGIPVAETYKVDKRNLGKINALIKKHGEVVLKPIFSQGQGIYCNKVDLKTPEKALKKILDSMPGNPIQIQQYIDYKKLIRVIVIGYKALREATVYDVPAEGWKCSVCLNPEIKKYTPQNDVLFKLAEKTAKAFGAQINFIDFFEDANGDYILNEINTACSLRIHENVSGCKIHKHIGDFLAKHALKDLRVK